MRQVLYTIKLDVPCPNRRRRGLRASAALPAICCVAALFAAAPGALAQRAVTLDGPPVQVQPYAPEPGVPLITIPTGTPTPAPPPDPSGGGNGADNSSSDALNTLLGTPDGATVIAEAQAMGVNPSALAATCVIESGCQNVGGPGTVAGEFQMTASTFTASINEAIAQNPALADQIVPGLAGQMDPATEAIAAAQYLKDATYALQSAGVANPTILDTRGYYNFGPSGAALANADDSQLMSQAMPSVTQKTFSANGVTAGETVGQWKASVSAKIGNAANQSVLS